MPGEIYCAVWMVTYNHEEYIERAIQSVIDQDTNFRYKIFIGDDNSKDRTAEICQALSERYPDKIELVINQENIGSKNNGVKTYYRCFESGAEYIALLEGDDFWLDPHKLQKQADFMDAHQEYVGCFHNAEVIDGNGFVRLYNNYAQDIRFTQDEIVKSLEMPTSSIFFRNKVREFPGWLLSCCLDITIYYYFSSYGDFYGSKEVMSAYRIHVGGIWTGQLEEEKLTNHILIRSNILKFLPLSKTQRKVTRQIIVDGRLRRMKYFSNTFSYKLIFYKDLFYVLMGKITCLKVSLKYLIYCILPDKFISFFGKSRKVNLS